MGRLDDSLPPATYTPRHRRREKIDGALWLESQVTEEMATIKHKKNLGGGKGFKGQAGKEDRRTRKNREMVTDFIEDLLAGDVAPEVCVARVVKNFGGARMSLLTVRGETKVAAMRNLLRCSRGAARNAANAVAVTPGAFVILHEEDPVCQVVGVLRREQVLSIRHKLTDAPRGFFDEGGAEEGDCGFDWDEGTATASGAAAAGGGGGVDDLDIDAI